MLKHLPIAVSERLLSDQSAGQNILWLTDNYQALGDGYQPDCPLTADNVHVVQPRSRKSEEEQLLRTRSLGEVFTPVPVVRLMVDSCQAPSDWRDFVTARWLEVACGEAPFLATPYDSVTGEAIPLPERCGVLDRKLQAVSDNTDNEPDWLHWAMCALQSVYGFELQGDSLLIARRNLLSAYCEHLQARWRRDPSEDECLQAADIIAWNLWQMDGLQGIEQEYEPEVENQTDMFNTMGPPITPDPPDCFLMDWTDGTKMKWGDTLKKFDFIIGNPPYQEETKGTSDKPVYNHYMDLFYPLADKVMLVTPARFLFDAGKTPKEWNKKMLNDPHLKVLKYEPDSKKVFPKTAAGCDVDIEGGIAVTLRDAEKDFGAIEVFSPYEELRGVREKVTPFLEKGRLSDIMILQNRFRLDALYEDFPECANLISSGGKERRIVTSSFDKLPVFSDTEIENGIQILGISKLKRRYKWIDKKYVEDNGNLYKWKVIIPKSNGSGAIGKIVPTPVIGTPAIIQPSVGYTQSFIGIGALETEGEASAVLKYIKSKFARALLGLLKITQDNPPEKWKYVPQQNFTAQSDINWDTSIAEIDKQLYEKYGLSAEEIAFIESKVKAME